MNVEEANHIILKPYITEKTFALVENESRICFLVREEASKPKIVEAVTLSFRLLMRLLRKMNARSFGCMASWCLQKMGKKNTYQPPKLIQLTMKNALSS